MRKIAKVFVAVAFFLASLVVVGKGAEASTTNNYIGKDNKQANQLVLKHASEVFGKKDGMLKVAWHESHYSHDSHASHDSHSSHYSSSY